MEKYLNKRRNSPITNYSIEEERIIVWFINGKPYSYSYQKAGRRHVEHMKILAINGSHLCAYINKYVRQNYDK